VINIAESDKPKRKVFLPKDSGINYIGLIIGPKGMYQKKLEEQTHCRILIRGGYILPYYHSPNKSEDQQVPPGEEEEQHVLVCFKEDYA